MVFATYTSGKEVSLQKRLHAGRARRDGDEAHAILVEDRLEARDLLGDEAAVASPEPPQEHDHTPRLLPKVLEGHGRTVGGSHDLVGRDLGGFRHYPALTFEDDTDADYLLVSKYLPNSCLRFARSFLFGRAFFCIFTLQGHEKVFGLVLEK